MLAFAAEMFGDKSTEEVGWSSHSHQYAVIGVNSSTFLAANPSLSGILLYEGNIRLVQD